MKNYTNKKGFTIAELTVAMLLICFIAMLLMPIVFNDSKKQVLITSLNKHYTTLLEIHHAIPMLQARGKISPGSIDTTTFMQAAALTQKAIGLNSDGTVAGNNKFRQYISGYTTTPNGIVAYTQFSLNDANAANTTIILKSGVFISRYNNTTIMIDINGRKTPNRTGEDIFFFEIISNNLGNDGTNSVLQPASGNCNPGDTFANSSGCAKEYLERGRME